MAAAVGGSEHRHALRGRIPHRPQQRPRRTLRDPLLPGHAALRRRELRRSAEQRLPDAEPHAAAAGTRIAQLLQQFSPPLLFRPDVSGIALRGADPAALCAGRGLLPLIPLVVLLFRRTPREAVVALSGAILPLFFAGFIHWAAGGRFDGPVRQVAAAITSDSGYRFFDGNTLFSLIAWGVIFFLLICSAAGVLLDIRTLKTKPRNILFLQFIRLVRRGRHLFCTVFFTGYTDPCGTGRSYAHPRRADQIQQCGRIDVLYGSYFTEPRSRPDIETRKVSIVANMDFCIVWRYIYTITHCIIQCFIIHLSCKHMESLF